MTFFSKKPSIPLISFVGFCLLFSIWPQLDILVSSWFYDETASPSFYLNGNPLIEFIYWIFKDMPLVIVPTLLILSIWGGFRNAPPFIKRHARKWSFMLAFLLLGPGIVVHTGFKDTWDRARPRDVIEFGGDKQFTPAWQYTDQCDKNCSFVSGHAAMGFAFMALGWVMASRRWLMFGICMGLGVGVVRIVMGGHFLSDIIFAGYICYFVAWIMARLILKRFDIEENRLSNKRE